MSTKTLNGLRFRRVAIVTGTINRGVFCDVKNTQVCDALICRRCTSVLVDEAQAERHVCMPINWMCGASIADVEEVPSPQKPRERVQIANAAHMTDLWPHGLRVPKPRAPLVERYETLSVLVAELAHMERVLEARATVRKRQPKK